MPKFNVPSFGGMLPGQDDRQRIVKKKDGLFADVGSTARRSWAKTKETLNPARLNPMNLFAAGDAAAPSEPKKPGFFSSLFAPPEEPTERVATVNDFLNQERPR